jgi:branched-chain amino acid transport system substrate-binding protein
MDGRRRRRRSVKRFLVVAAVGALAALTAALGGSTAYGGSSSSNAAAPIKIGALTSLTGNFAPWGIQARSGMALAVNEINRAGGVKGRGGGRRLSLVVADDQSSNTNAAIDGFRRLTQQENVVAVGGTIGSNIGLPVSRLAEEAKVPYFLVKSGNNEIRSRSGRKTYRAASPAPPLGP